MRYQILVENGDQEAYTATVVGLPDCRAQAATPQEAVASVQQALEARLARAEVIWLDVPASIEHLRAGLMGTHPDSSPFEPVQVSTEGSRITPYHPWLKHAGVLKDNPLFDSVQENIAAYRRELDTDPEVA
ncbi:MAG: type II toxin-antitoxin system HicB family antitoxin [Chloroflexi bacterium]|nr:type II toxin-antitoxin system HicB family antitoxin [Chloroflexota bacterium]